VADLQSSQTVRILIKSKEFQKASESTFTSRHIHGSVPKVTVPKVQGWIPAVVVHLLHVDFRPTAIFER
jgi:hypothetical protein